MVKYDYQPVYQVRPGRDAGWQDCSEQRYRVVGGLMEEQAAAVIKSKQNWTWDRRVLYKRVEINHVQD